MQRFRGKVKNNVIVLEEGVHLSDGTEVEVRLPSDTRARRRRAIERILKNPITRHVGIDEIIEEDKKEHENHPCRTDSLASSGRQ